MNGNGNGHIHYEASSGNVFADLSLPHAESLLVKTTLMLRIREELAARRWDAAHAAAAFDLSVHDIEQLDESDPDAFTLETLVEMLVGFGYDVTVRVAPRATEAARLTAEVSLPAQTDKPAVSVSIAQ